MASRLVLVLLCLFLINTHARAGELSAVGEDAYGCNAAEDLAHLRLMAGIRTAFDIALDGKIEAGECAKLSNGEPLTKIEETSVGSLRAFKVRRADGQELFVEVRFAKPAI